MASFELCILNIHDDNGGTNIFLHYRAQPIPSTHVYFEGGYKGTAEQNNQIIQAMDFIFNRIDVWMNEGKQFQVSDVHILPNELLMAVEMKNTVVEIMDFISSNKLQSRE